MISSRLKLIIAPVLISLIFFAIPSSVECKKGAAAATEPEATIEEVSAKQLEKILLEKDYVAVYWCKCHPSKSMDFHFISLCALNNGRIKKKFLLK